jgi:hypothetical protein
VSLLGLVLVAGGLGLVAVGRARARVPWSRYQAMRAQEANAERYRAWRGGLGDAAGGTTGADVMKAVLRSRVRRALAVAAAGVVLVIAGLVVR